MYGFLQPQTIAALGASQFIYDREFTIAAASGSSANTQGSGNIAIQSGIHFFAESLWIAYPTVQEVESDLIDDGVCRLTLQLNMGTTTPMFQNPARLDIIGVPGRTPVEGALTELGETPAPGQTPRIPGFPFARFLPAGTSLSHVFANLANVDATVFVLWRGWNIPTANCPNQERFNEIVRSCQHMPTAA